MPDLGPVPDLGLEGKRVPDPGAVQFGGRRGDRRGVVVVAAREQSPVTGSYSSLRSTGTRMFFGSSSRFAVVLGQ
ncbi:hypothetical protein [Streptomyces sp. SYSU K21746]